MRLVFDIECDNLLDKATTLHVIKAYDLDEHSRYTFLGHENWQELFEEAELLIGHNIIGFDLPAMQKLKGYVHRGRIHDTLLLSQILNYDRPGGHSLAAWGDYFGFPKIEFHDFSRYTPEMDVYCERDVDLNVLVYDELMAEYAKQRSKELGTFIKNEHAAARWQAQAQLDGWPMDRTLMEQTYLEISREVREAEAKLEPKLGFKIKYTDRKKGEIEPKAVRISQSGMYHSQQAKYFGVHPDEALDEVMRPVSGTYTRIEVQPLKLSYSEDVKIFLYRHGWEPSEWNWVTDKETGKKRRTSAKITEDSLEFLGGDGGLYTSYVSAVAREGILRGWLEKLTNKDRLHGDSMIIGTPSMRLTHSVIANIPSADAAYGAAFRKMFITQKGRVLIGSDSSGNQARGLAFFINNDEFTRQLLEGDIHTYNANVLTEAVRKILSDPSQEVSRSAAKRILYAFLFGAAGGKLWSYLFGVNDSEKGNLLKEAFMKAVPGFTELVKGLENEWARNKKKYGVGWIRGLTGNRIYVNSKHKLLVYLLQSTEKATCSAALAYIVDEFEKRQIPYWPRIYYHDEVEFETLEEHREIALEISAKAFKEAPKVYGINIMDGEARAGANWLDVH